MTLLKTPITFTANRLLDGEAVWLGVNGRWVEDVNSALVIKTEADKETQAAIAHKADADNVVVEPYEIDISVDGAKIIPVRFREQIRAAGPTFRLDLGKQANTTAHAA